MKSRRRPGAYGLILLLGFALQCTCVLGGAWAASGEARFELTQNLEDTQSNFSEEDEELFAASADQSLMEELWDGFYWRVNLLTIGILRDPETKSVLNFDNRQNVNRYQAEVNLRPDFSLDFRRVELAFKPRFEYRWKKWSEGSRDGSTNSDTSLFVNEWLARLRLTDELFISYGRENLQWGPSQLISVSNPFNKDNAKNNPKREVDGLDYGRLVYIPTYNWTISAIANTDDGRKDFNRPFEERYALKVDFTGHQKYFSLIPSYADEDGEWNLGFFGGWSATDALLLYGEGNLFIESSDPRIDNGDVNFLLGSSYTFRAGPTLYLEYYHNEGGCSDAIELCLPPIGDANLDNNGLTRTDYILVQLVDSDRWEVLDTIVRWIWNVDDSSNRLISILEYELSNYVELFTIGDLFFGNRDSELGSVLDASLFFGFEFTF